MKVYVSGSDKQAANWLMAHLVYKIDEADIVLFTGGPDVDPDLYGEPSHPHTKVSVWRDLDDLKTYKKAIKLKIPMVGVCRGAQFLCVMAGGRLVQHQKDAPFLHHEIETTLLPRITVNSSHHQAMWPWMMCPDDFVVLGWSRGISPYHENGYHEEVVDANPLALGREVEIAYFRKNNALCIQSHPEWCFPPKDIHEQIFIQTMRQYLRLMLDKKL